MNYNNYGNYQPQATPEDRIRYLEGLLSNPQGIQRAAMNQPNYSQPPLYMQQQPQQMQVPPIQPKVVVVDNRVEAENYPLDLTGIVTILIDKSQKSIYAKKFDTGNSSMEFKEYRVVEDSTIKPKENPQSEDKIDLLLGMVLEIREGIKHGQSNDEHVKTGSTGVDRDVPKARSTKAGGRKPIDLQLPDNPRRLD